MIYKGLWSCWRSPLLGSISFSYKTISPSNYVSLVQFFELGHKYLPFQLRSEPITVPKLPNRTNFFLSLSLNGTQFTQLHELYFISPLCFCHSLLRGLLQDTIVWAFCSFSMDVGCHGNMDGLHFGQDSLRLFMGWNYSWSFLLAFCSRNWHTSHS